MSSTRAKKLEIAARERNAIAIIEKHSSISCAEIAEILKCTTTEANHVLRRLVSAGTHVRVLTTKSDANNNRITEYTKASTSNIVEFVKKEQKTGPTLIEQAREKIRESGRTESIDNVWLAGLMNITTPQASSILQSMTSKFELEVHDAQMLKFGRSRSLYRVIGLIVEPEKRRVQLERAAQLVSHALSRWSVNSDRFFSLRGAV